MVFINERFTGVKRVLLAVIVLGFSQINAAKAQVTSASERGAAALGHYARARAMLVEALAEFEKGKKLARPDMLVDPDLWRSEVISRAEELNRLLDPQPRVTKSGVQFKANSRLIRAEREKSYGIGSGTTKHEEGAEKVEPAAIAIKPPVKIEKIEKETGELVIPPQKIELDQKPGEEAKVLEQPPAAPVIDQKQAERSQVESLEVGEEDPEISKAIEEAIMQRMKKLEAEKGENKEVELK